MGFLDYYEAWAQGWVADGEGFIPDGIYTLATVTTDQTMALGYVDQNPGNAQCWHIVWTVDSVTGAVSVTRTQVFPA